MAINSLSPCFCKIFYTTGTRQHVMTIPLRAVDVATWTPGDSAEDTELTTKSGVAVTFAAFCDEFADNAKALLNTADGFTIAELYRQPTPEDDPTFITVYELGVAGTNAAARTPYGQYVMSFRTSNGGIYKIYVMECSAVPNQRDAYPFSGVTNIAFATYFTSNQCPIVGRDGGNIISPLRYTTKTNDALRKKQLLDG